jgi:hypothetical protein
VTRSVLRSAEAVRPMKLPTVPPTAFYAVVVGVSAVFSHPDAERTTRMRPAE